MAIGFDVDGNPIALPGTAIGWRIRRAPRALKPHGVITGADGTPLLLALDVGPADIAAALAELEEAQPGRYRLEPVDQHARPVGTDAAYWDLRPQLLAELGKELGIAAPAPSAAPDPAPSSQGVANARPADDQVCLPRVRFSGQV
jgi:hypothetical protein